MLLTYSLDIKVKSLMLLTYSLDIKVKSLMLLTYSLKIKIKSLMLLTYSLEIKVKSLMLLTYSLDIKVKSLTEFLKFVRSIGPRGQKIMRSANNIGNADPHVRQTFFNDVFTFLTEV